ncbi:MAG: O-antigen ligase family protein [Patescibacteria group bacterium]
MGFKQISIKNTNKIIEYGLYLLAFLLPWQTRWIIKGGEINNSFWEYGTISLYGTDILLIIVILLFIINVLKFSHHPSKARNLHSDAPNPGFRIKCGMTVCWWFIAGLELIIFISIFFASDKVLALYKYGVFLLGIGLFWLIVSASYSRAKLFWSLLAGIILQASLGIWQFLSQSSFANKWLGMALHNPADLGISVIETIGADGIGERWLRAYGGLDHPNVLGGILAVGILLLIAHSNTSQAGTNLQMKRKYTNIQLSYYLIILLFLMAIFFTFSRGAWAGLLVGIILILVIAVIKKDLLSQKNVLNIIFISSIFIFILFSQFSNLVLTRLSKDTRLEIKSNIERVESFKEAKIIIKNNWLFGAGIGNYTLALNEQKPGLSVFSYQPVHNVFLLILAEVGLLGLLGFLGLFGYLGWLAWQRNPSMGLPILLAIAIMMMVDHWFWSLHFGVLFFWMTMGLIAKEVAISKI